VPPFLLNKVRQSRLEHPTQDQIFSIAAADCIAADPKGLLGNNLEKEVLSPFALRYRRVNGTVMLRYLSMTGDSIKIVQVVS
jgi:hypothetical protein